MNVLVGYESSGVIRDAFLARGHHAVSCDLKPSERPGPHYQEPIQCMIGRTGHLWDLLICHPDCTYLCSSGLHWNTRRAGRRALTEAALDEVRWLLSLPIPMIALENPRGCIGSHIRRADQIIQPYEFGHDASKETHLWLKNLPKLRPTQYVAPRMVDGRPRWGNQTDSGQNKLGPSPTRAVDRARTYQGWADAMADQWGDVMRQEWTLSA